MPVEIRQVRIADGPPPHVLSQWFPMAEVLRRLLCSKHRTPLLVGRGLVAALLLVMSGCPRATAPTAKRPLSVVVSCDTAGWIVPCGCSSKQAGGLLRRATYVRGLQTTSDVLLADAGGAPGGTAPYDLAKFVAVLRGEIQMQTAAHNLGAAEAELGAESLRSLVQKTQAKLVSSNVIDEQGAHVTERFRLATIGSQRIAVLGVLSPKFAAAGLRVDDPVESVLQLIPTLKGQYDVLLVLAYLPEDELERFVVHVPEADLVVGGPTQQSIAPRRNGPTTWAATTNKGKFLVHLRQPVPSSNWDGEIVELSEDIADDPDQLANLQRFRDELARVDFTADQTHFSLSRPTEITPDFQVAGTDACRACHANDCQKWSDSRHGHAWKTLVDKGSHVDPYCQQCHTTGYSLPGGFQSLAQSQMQVNVGCESCHGPSLAHARKPTTKTIYDARDRCLQCHDHENSPLFEYDTFWKKIDHGEPARVGEGK